MIKVRILTGVTAAGAAALAIPSLVGCGSANAQDDAVGSGNQNQEDIESIAGQGQISLHSYALHYQSTTGGDEFIRVGEKLKVAVDFNDVLSMMVPLDADDQTALAAVKADPSKLKLSAKITSTKSDEAKSDTDVAVTFAPGAGGALVGTSEELTVGKGVKTVSLALSATYTKAGKPITRDVLSSQGVQTAFSVFGAFLPDKLAFFDTVGGDKRTRIVEGGSLIPGAHVTLAYADWRCDTVVDKSSLDLKVGKYTNYSRFGVGVADALGTLEYVVGAVVSTDGGATFNPIAMQKIDKPEVFSRADGYRFAMQALASLPAGAGPNVQVAFHIQAVLVVPTQSQFSSPLYDMKYPQGSRQVLKDVWDNNGGKNYTLAVGKD